MKSKAVQTAGKILTFVLAVLILLLFLYVMYLFWCNMSGNVPFVGKYAVMRVISPSMEPDIPTGSFILIKKTDTEELKVGDVITFRSTDPSIFGKMNTHNIAEINSDGSFITKGTNNPVSDSYAVEAESVVGKFIRILPMMSWFSRVLNNGAMLFLIIIIAAVIMFAVCLSSLAKTAKKTRIEQAVAEEVARLKAEAVKPNETNNNIGGVDTYGKKSEVEETNQATGKED